MTVPSLLILGTDAVLASAPGTPVQLAHACLAAGYQAVIPASWGDELIAARAMDRCRRAEAPVVQCSCPFVASRFAAHGEPIASMLLSFVAPPVATAEYLRALYAPTPLHLTFAGGCPSASHESIDVWLSTNELTSALAERGIITSAQPTEFDSVIPPDRRRFFSEPGGVPSRSALRHLPAPVEFVEVKADDLVIDIAQHLLSNSRALIDAAPALGCCCSGAVGGVSPEAVRARVREHEPPRALAPVVDHSLPLALDSVSPGILPAPPPLESIPGATILPPRPPSVPDLAPDPLPVAVEAIPRRRSPPGLTRAVLGIMPQARIEAGRQLPRAYVARRRSSPRGLRESAVRHVEPPTAPRAEAPGIRWFMIAAIGVAVGLVLAWIFRLGR
ncbi:MAG: hypothetical protein WD825_15790 [Gemmatimonadaceae bacterium]